MNQTSIFPNHVFDRETGWRLDMPTDIPEGTRVLCLLRVSTEKQLYHTDGDEADIPMQRIRCREFCERMGWTIVCELQEEGVSGHKVRAEKRDRIQQIKDYTKKKLFDILLVFMFDRLGRIADETPFVVEWFVKNGIRVWSTQEGEQRFDNHTDKLTNYIRFWQADGESEKISIRTSNSMGILTQEGCFTGGTRPYGYNFVKTGRVNRRKHEVYDLEICEEEAVVVRKMFSLAAVEGYGAQRIANYLNANGIKNRSGKNWHPASIQGMLRNILYTGILRSGESRSPVQERLQIVDDKTFATVQSMLQARSRASEGIRSSPLNTRGKSLLAGNIFCGHCGARLCITTSGKGRKRQDGTDVVRMRYTCQTKSRTHGDCDGQTGYTVSKLDHIVDAAVHAIFRKVDALSYADVMEAGYQNDLAMQKLNFQKAKRSYEKAEQELQVLKDEIIKSIMGNSTFTPELLQEAIRQQEQKCAILREEYANAERENLNNEARAEAFAEKYKDIREWSEIYDNASMSAKKMIISRLIERVEVRRGYQITIKLRIGYEQFVNCIEKATA